ncbi:MAG: glycosyltransferase family 2 protein [Phycisphaeraceae bacterium]|nr:glycosyltransferase family 2 protein [Phycisphaeraceae bacterium]
MNAPNASNPAPGGPPPWPTAPDGSPIIEVMIPTYNEAGHISETVANARRLGPVFVLDSLSTDGTQRLAAEAGATVVEHPFENYSRQKNWGLDNLPFRGRWIFILDADERITPELRDELFRVASQPDAAVGYYVNRVVIMMGRAIRHGGMMPSWNLRFFQRGKARYEDRSVHEHMICDGATRYLRHLMLHIRRETLSEYLAKHIRYADMESDEWIKGRKGENRSAKAGTLFRNLLGYRLYLRRDVWPYVPYKPFARFIYMYILRLGFLDGAAGWHLAQLMASYEYMIKLLYEEKLQRLRDRANADRADRA